MDDALDQGLYASVTGNKGWRPVNENYTQLFLTHWAGPQATYDAITGAIPWTDASIAEAMQKSAEWFQADYLAGEDYFNLNFLDAVSLLSSNDAPFFFGPSLVFQFATSFYSEEDGNLDELGFFPLPSREGCRRRSSCSARPHRCRSTPTRRPRCRTPWARSSTA